MIKGTHVSKAYQKNLVLDDVEFLIQNGEIVAIFGDSGTGKSTLSNILTGLTSLDNGEIYLDDKLLVSKKKKYDRKLGLKIQIVFQSPVSSLDPSQRIENNLKELIRYHHLAKKNEENEFIKSYLKKLNLKEEILSHYPHQISGGEAQRVVILKALMLKPSVLIMDEATSMLDVITQAQIMRLVKDEFLTNETSIILISHDKELVHCMANRIYKIENKKLTEATR